jgi:hypothetical protein
MTNAIPLPIMGRDRVSVLIGNVMIYARKVEGHVFVDLVKAGDHLEDAIASVMCTADGHPPIMQIEEARRIAATP